MALLTAAQTAVAQEKLQRHVMAVPQAASGTSYLVTWRMLDTDDDYTTFDVIRNDQVIAKDINSCTNYRDTRGSKTAQYRIVTRRHGVAVDTTDAVAPWQDVYMQMQLDRPEGGTFHDATYDYSPNDCSVADVDGDGRYEILVKWEPSNPADNSQGGFTGPTIFDCYRFDEPIANSRFLKCERLWRVEMGHNIRSGPHYVPFLFYDFNGDGKAEMIVKTGPGTKDGKGRYVTEVADEEVIRATDNEKEYLNGGGQVMYGPEFLTVFDGRDGHAIHTVYYNPNRGCFVGGAPECRSDIWGDDYGNRSERYLATVAHLDAQHPTHASAVMCRGYYTRSYLWAVDFDGQKLSTRWRHASLSKNTVMQTEGGTKHVYVPDAPTYDDSPFRTAYGQGNHNISCGDVDGDGMDEIIYGSAAIDDDGTLLWSTGLCHGDAIHMGDLMPDHPGLEVFQIHEDPPYGMHICDAATGELLIHKTGEGDTGRGMAADVMNQRGYEFWYWGDAAMYNASTDKKVGDAMSTIFRIYWDGDVYDELLSDVSRHNQPYLEKYGVGRLTIDNKQVYQYGYNVTCNGTKGTPCLTADILGDWREEMIFFNNEDKRMLNIFSTSTVTTARVPCLMYDHTYRLGVAWENVGYNQPPHLGYYLPDATAARFTVEESGMNEAGDSLFITIHYVNCTTAAVSKVTRPDGTTATLTSAGFKLTKDATLCTLTIAGKPTDNGTWQFDLKAATPANGIATTETISVEVSGADGIMEMKNEKVKNEKCDDAIYDLQGRKVNSINMRGIYVKNGKKIVIK
ncbi:MAG: rhamnogalacturonan lyase [Prevotella sp.]|nr:rhamnogalacturonan lyase [Prevotella sp.]